MKEYCLSQFVKTIVQQSNIRNQDIPQKFKPNETYIPPEYVVSGDEDSNSNSKVFLMPSDPNPVNKAPNQIQDTKPKKTKASESKPGSLQDIYIPNYDGKVYQQMKPVILGEIEEEKPKPQKSFLQALRQGNCIIQLPNKLPFQDIGKNQKIVEKIQGDQVQQQLNDYYDECYDSSGIHLQKQYTNLSNTAGVGINIGKIQIAQNGTAIWKAGREEFEIVQGINQDLDQKCLVINKDDGQCGFIEVGDKFVITSIY